VIESLYKEEDVERAIPQIINRMRLINLKKELINKQRQISQKSPDEDLIGYLAEIKSLQQMRLEIEALQENVRSLSSRSESA
jgi:hypothetical protein